MRLLYTLLWYLALPGVFLRMAWRSRSNSGYRQRWAQRLGFVPRLAGRRRPIWVHAVSVGETVAAAPLIQALRSSYPERPILVTSTTPTGFDRVHALFGNEVIQAQMPFDLPGAVARFLRRTHPAAAIIMETEIWPNLFRACARRGIPVIMANARLSERSAAGYRRVGRTIARSLTAVHFVAAQSAIDAERFRSLGVSGERLVVAGNLKYDIQVPPGLSQQAEALRAALGEALIWLAASTHEGEERQVLDAFATVRLRQPALRLLLVPRHPERFDTVAELCEARGWRVSRRSRGWQDAKEVDVLLGDTMGELDLFYASADFCLVGGSLVPIGGHNILEPAAAGCPIIVGPHTFKMEDMRQTFDGALIAVADAAELADAVGTLAESDDQRERLRQAATGRLHQQAGATGRIMALVASLLGQDDGQARGGSKPANG